MKTAISAAILVLPLMIAGCDDPKADAPPAASAVALPSAAPAPTPTPAPSASTPPAPAFVKKTLADCKPHPATVEFDDAALENEVRRKLSKEKGPITPADLGTIKSINLAQAPVNQIDPCIYPMFTSMKDLFLGPGDYDDLSPLQKLTNIETIRAALSRVKDLHPIEGLKRMDRLDISHTLVSDDDLKAVGSLTNLTELMLDEDSISDLTPVANLKKLEKLSIKKTRVQNLAPIAGIKTLKYLYIAEAPISDISPVQPLVAGPSRLKIIRE